jgi:serine/threonine protein kinase
MDFCTDGTLEKWIKDRCITDLIARDFLADLVAGVAYLHIDKQIVYRDLKPANIFITRGTSNYTGRPMLVLGDLGSAKRVMGSRAKVTTVGTPLYMAPETREGPANCSLASDVYACSLVAVELVTGEVVHDAATSQRDADRAVRLAQLAAERMTGFLDFEGQSELTPEAARLLLNACTILEPAERLSIKVIRQPRATRGDKKRSSKRIKCRFDRWRVWRKCGCGQRCVRSSGHVQRQGVVPAA